MGHSLSAVWGGAGYPLGVGTRPPQKSLFAAAQVAKPSAQLENVSFGGTLSFQTTQKQKS
jgi:hypothetical protein